MAKTEGTYIRVAYKNVFGYISTNSWPFFMIQRPTIRGKCAWVRSNTWRDKIPVATGLDRLFSVFWFFNKHCNWQPKKFRICATATGGPDFCILVQFNFGLFFQSSEPDLQTLGVRFRKWTVVSVIVVVGIITAREKVRESPSKIFFKFLSSSAAILGCSHPLQIYRFCNL